MGLGDFFKDQFIDVIEFVDDSPEKLLVSKFARKGDEIKQGARLVVRNGQAAVFAHRGIIADEMCIRDSLQPCVAVPAAAAGPGDSQRGSGGICGPGKCGILLRTLRFPELSPGRGMAD